MRFGLQSGVFVSVRDAIIGGGGALLSASSTQLGLQVLGFAAILFGFGHILWGITIDGRQWWRQAGTRKRVGVRPISLDDAFRYIAEQSKFGARLDRSDPKFSIWISDTMQSALENGDLAARGRKYHVLKGGIKDPPLHPRTNIKPAFWSRHHASAYWALNQRSQQVAGSEAFSAVPPNKYIEGDGQYEGYHDIHVDGARMRLIWPKK